MRNDEDTSHRRQRPFSEWAWAMGQAPKVQISALLVTSCVILNM